MQVDPDYPSCSCKPGMREKGSARAPFAEDRRSRQSTLVLTCRRFRGRRHTPEGSMSITRCSGDCEAGKEPSKGSSRLATRTKKSDCVSRSETNLVKSMYRHILVSSLAGWRMRSYIMIKLTDGTLDHSFHSWHNANSSNTLSRKMKSPTQPSVEIAHPQAIFLRRDALSRSNVA